MLLHQHNVDDRIVRCRYRFTLSDGTEKEFDVCLDARTLALRTKNKADYPAWTRLSYRKCQNCPLRTRRRCPVAVNLVDVVETLKDQSSAEKIEVEVAAQSGSFKGRGG